jgi:LuxR family transcriptional regulator, glucitol operon activator
VLLWTPRVMPPMLETSTRAGDTMSYTASRQTLYALISAIELDLRALILTHLMGLEVPTLLGESLFAKAGERREREVGDEPASLEGFIEYLDFGDLYQLLNANRAALPAELARYIKDVTPHLERLVPVRNRVAHVRPLDADDLPASLDLANELAEQPNHPWGNLASTLVRLKEDPSFVLGLALPVEEVSERMHNLPTPEFDETGFYGRGGQVAELLRLVLGPYPVVTIVGEGGIGKTSLALKVAYELTDMRDCPFDAVVWTTAKTARLTATEIQRIHGAISDSLGMFESIASTLGAEGESDLLDQILEYLEQFRVLLILDNLETVLDEKVRGFLERLPAGSKVMITSRIGLGAFEFPVRLAPMTSVEAVQLLRALTKVRGVPQLVKMGNERLARYASRMGNNPGFLRWFVAAVQAGARPEDALARPDLFLDFCMTNVYDYLSQDGRMVLRSMLYLSGAHSQAELAYVNDMDALELQRALQELLTTNMVAMSSTPRGASFETEYELSDLSRAYLNKRHPIEPEQGRQLARRRRQLTATVEQLQAERNTNPYSFFSIAIRSKRDLVVAKFLFDALRAAWRDHFDVSQRLLDQARALAPDYFEVHRVEALIRVRQNDIVGARSAYETAIEIEPSSAPLRLWFGGFLLRYEDETEQALAEFRAAADLDPASHEVQLEMARADLYLGNFAEAQAILGSLLRRTDIPTWARRKTADLNLQYFQRTAEQLVVRRDYLAALEALESLRKEYIECSPSLRDERMRERLAKSVWTARRVSAGLRESDAGGRTSQLIDWLMTEARVQLPTAEPIAETRLPGRIKRLGGLDFGFIVTPQGDEIFFRRSAVRNPGEWTALRLGDAVSYSPGANRKGPCALDVVPESNPGLSPTST